MTDHATTPVEAAVLGCRISLQSRLAGGHACHYSAAAQLHLPWPNCVVTVGVLALLVFLFTQLLNSAATVTTLGHKQMDADSQARDSSLIEWPSISHKW